MTTQPKASASSVGRIVSLDLMRGWFLVIIILDHLTYFPNGLTFLTGDSRLAVSAAEGFFIISGLVLGIVRGAKLRTQPLMAATRLLWKRTGTLYLTSIIVTMLSLLISWFFIDNKGVKLPLPLPDGNWLGLAWDIITLQQFYGWADYLRLYALFIAVAPGALWLLRRGKWYIVLGLSLLVWALTPRPVSELYQPLTWQVLFFMAFALGYHLPEITARWQSWPLRRRRIIKRSIATLFVLTLFADAYVTFVAHGLGDGFHQALAAADTALDNQFLKLDLPLPRLALSWLWFAGFFMLFRRFEDRIKRWLGWILLPFGHNSLYVYTMHAFVILVMHLFVAPDYYISDFYFTSVDRFYEIPGNFALSMSAVALIYLAVKTKFLMKIIPR